MNTEQGVTFVCDLIVSNFRDPSIKRTVCKHCHALLIPGITARVRVRRKLCYYMFRSTSGQDEVNPVF